MLKTNRVGYWYGDAENKLFENVNLEFLKGRLYSIIGKSGSGKTTFLSLIAGLARPSEGSIEFNGRELSKIGLLNYRKKCVSMVFQSYNLFSYMSAIENILTAMSITGSKNAGNKKYVLEMLDQVGIDEASAKRRVSRLSGGQQQRVAIVRTMCCDAQLVVADEPTGNLDETSTKDVLSLLQKIAHEQQKCVILVTHELDVAKACDSVIELHQKKFEYV
ncbi:ABC transporter ATP-binding protein [Liquorilactobacillus oeni]|uniref:Peptide ABC transporter ATPase n=1 Tax=Liquorilactobacillus oeni DSM 19972 TaxID=1423777 RepID=A0A0R1MBB9_9LACO|nr:ABC transporter ATP-binding protein [Liquorilactobacillus oeni]KRL05613.1 peptide ABC transporter ATPase [Liquorilactobacillus oeni DSM 19972]